MTRTSAHRRDWEDLAQTDPLWAIVSSPNARHRGFDLEAFYSDGRHKAAKLLARLDDLGVPATRGRALDFGCGAGRITLPLAEAFDAVVGVDIAPSMLALARTRAAADGIDSIEFRLDESGDQSLLAGERFDLVYSALVLQHLPSSAAALATLGRLCASVAPGGVLVVQLPTSLPLRSRLPVGRLAYGALRRLGLSSPRILRRAGLHPMRMTAVPRPQVDACLQAAGLAIVRADERREHASTDLTVYAARPL